MYQFTVTGLQQTSEPLKPIYTKDDCDPTTRIRFLKMKGHDRFNKAKMISAMTGGNVTPTQHYEEKIDLIETDYHEK